MTKHFYSVKKLPIFLAISAVILIAGIVLYALFGFNCDSGAGKSFEVTYDAVVTISDGGDRVEEVCEETFSSVGIDYEKKYEAAPAIDSSSLADTGDFTVRYLFGEDVSDETLAAVKNTVEGVLTSEFEGAEIYIAVRSQAAASTFAEPAWRGAVALAVAAVVVLVYIGFRFGWGRTLTGLCLTVHDVFLTLALLAITRIPVAAAAPLLFAAAAAVISLLLWMVQCMKMRETFKDPAFRTMDAEEAVNECSKSSYKAVLYVVAALAVVFIVVGAVAAPGVRTFFLPLLLPLAVSAYSSLVLGPTLYLPMKKLDDRSNAKKGRYVGKKKAEKAEE